jgi:hypothetical protein
MLIPLHLIPIPADEPRGLGDPGHAWQPGAGLKIAQGVHLGDIRALGLTVAGATNGPVATADLLRFGQLMSDAGLAINPTRMLYDRQYAHECLAEALRPPVRPRVPGRGARQPPPRPAGPGDGPVRCLPSCRRVDRFGALMLG